MESKTIEIELINGERVGLTITFGLLYKLREKHKKNYEKYNDIVMNGIKDMLDYPTALYTAYLCKCVEEEKEAFLTEEEFRERLPFAMGQIVNTYKELYNAEKKLHSGDRLSAEQEG